MNLSNITRKYKYFLIFSFLFIIIFLYNNELGISTLKNIKSTLIQMLSVLPPTMIIINLIDAWIPRDFFINYMGNSTKISGIFLAFIFAFLGAGPLYAGFPFASILIKKEVKFSNIIIFLNAWCITKLSTLLFEIEALGYEFTLYRLIINIPGIIIIAYIIEYLVSKRPHKI